MAFGMYEAEPLFEEPVQPQRTFSVGEFMSVRDIEAQLVHEISLERYAREQGRVALFSLAQDGSMQLPEEVR